MDKKGILLVVSGPSGVGKGTVMKKLFEMRGDLYMSVSATTRKMREGEADGVNYHFKSEEEFLKIKKADGFLENAVFCGNYYGTLKSEVFSRLEQGINVVLEIEVKGAMKVRAQYPEGVYVYMLPPSLDELRERLIGRNTESDEKVRERLETAKWELEHIDKYNYLVENNEIIKAAQTISSIIDAEHVRMERCLERVKESLI